MVVALRTTLFRPWDDLLAATRAFIHPNVSRSGLDRGLRRPAVSHLQALIPQPEDDEQSKKTFKDDEPGFIHADIKYLPHMPDETAHRDLFVAIDRASRWVYVAIWGAKTAHHAAEFRQRRVDQAPFKVQQVWTDNGQAVTDRGGAAGERDPTGRHRGVKWTPKTGQQFKLAA